MDKHLGEVTEKVQQIPTDKRQVVIQYNLMGGSGGKGSSFDDLCRYAGVVNGAAVAGLGMNEVLSKEQIVRVNPDVILLPIWDYTGKTDIQKFGAEVQADQALQTVNAIRQRNLVPVPDRHMACSSQYIVYGVKDIAQAAYPQVFKGE
jgi:iron complex transport system substrate-binding protein